MNDEPRIHAPRQFAGPPPPSHFVNRAQELRQISMWAEDIEAGPILTIVGIGGIGKTALASAWFNDYASKMAQFQGRLWWSLYEREANQFLIECFSYLTRTAVNESAKLRPQALVEGIVRGLEQGKFLLVLDGLEKEMDAYSQRPGAIEAATSHSMRGVGSRMALLLRLCARTDSGSKILLTSRVAPVDLEDPDGDPLPGVSTLPLGSLAETAARAYFSQFAIEQSSELIDQARRYEFHPLIMSLLAHQMVSGAGPREGKKVVSSAREVVEASIGELAPGDRVVAEQIAAFDGPVPYSDLVYALIGKHNEFVRESELDQSLSRLQNLGLIIWNQTENTFTMHPVVKSAIRQNAFPLPAE